MVILVFSAVWLAEVGLKFGPAEMTALMLIAMTSISWLVGDDPSKGIVVTCLGMLCTTIGMDAVTGSPRYTFDNLYLLGGINFLPVTIGLVGFSTVIEMMATRNNVSQINAERLTIKGSLLTRHEMKRLLMPAVRSGLIGTFIGILPGAGATAATFVSYGVQKKMKNEVPLGDGSIEGLAAAESSNNAACMGSFSPLLALGIPGSGTSAILLGGLMMWGLNPGPLLFIQNPDFAWGLIASLFIANILLLFISLMLIPQIIKILRIPARLLIPIITVICFVGAYSSKKSMFDVLIMIIGGIVGYLLRCYKYAPSSFILAMVLTELLEVNLRRAFQISGGTGRIFFEKPISAVLMIVFAAIMLVPAGRGILKTIKTKKPARKPD